MRSIEPGTHKHRSFKLDHQDLCLWAPDCSLCSHPGMGVTLEIVDAHIRAPRPRLLPQAACGRVEHVPRDDDSVCRRFLDAHLADGEWQFLVSDERRKLQPEACRQCF